MVKIKYIAFFIFYMAVALLMTFRLGPLMVDGAKQMNTQPISIIGLDSIKISAHVANKNDIRVSLLFESQKIDLQFYTNEGKHLPLTQLFYKHGLFEKENDFPKDLPMSFSKERLHFITSVEVLYKEASNQQSGVDYLAINGVKIKGKIPVFRKYSSIVFGYLISIMGFAGCALILLSAYNYMKYGTEPRIPNRWEGLKHFISLFNKNKS
tara:strand:- start:202 stop:831 length:630 start_codon:yes stop_codon:yes gene_type:complete